MRKAICPGTFDPITNGHIDIIKRAAHIFEEVIVAVVKHPSKAPLFTFDERIELVRATTSDIKSIEVEGFDGLVVEFARKKKAGAIVRGLRMISDFEYEFQMALTNRNLDSRTETVFLMPHPRYSYISSRLIKEASSLGADLKDFLPPVVLKSLRRKIGENRSSNHKR